MIQQTTIPNLDICGLMVRGYVDAYPVSRCPCESCEGIIADAWERMTFAACQVAGAPSVRPFLIIGVYEGMMFGGRAA